MHGNRRDRVGYERVGVSGSKQLTRGWVELQVRGEIQKQPTLCSEPN